MKNVKRLLALLVFFGCMSAYGQTEIKMEELSAHVGDSVKVTTKIFGGIYLSQSQGTPTLLNAGGKYPDALLTLFIGPETRNKFSSPPEEMFKDKEITVTGKVILFKNKPEMVIYSQDQIVATGK